MWFPAFVTFSNINWYGVCYVIAFFLIRWIGMRMIKHQKLPISSNQISILCSLCFLTGIIMARCASLVLNYFQYGEISSFFKGGLAFQGGLIGGIAAGIWYLFYINKEYLILSIFDVSSQLIPIGIFIGRIGNYLAQEFMYQVLDMPACLFFAIDEGIILFFLIFIARFFLHRPGNISFLFLILYGFIRLINDSIRDEPVVFNGLKFSEWFCIAAIIIGLTSLILNQIYHKNQNSSKIKQD